MSALLHYYKLDGNSMTKWFLQRDILTQFSLARIMDERDQGVESEGRGRTWRRMIEIAKTRLKRTPTPCRNTD